jgi:hypothetical protein
MQRISSILTGAAVSVALVAGAAPVQAASPQPAPAIITSDQPAAGIRTVGDGDWRRRDRDDVRFGFSFGPPVVAYPRYAYRGCPYGYAFDGYGCVRTYSHYRPHRYDYGPRPGFSVQLGF